MAFNLVMTVDLCMTYMLMIDRFDDIGLDARSQWVGRGKEISVELSRQVSEHKTVGLLQDLDFETFT